MDHAVDVRMSLKDLVEVLLFPDVHFHKLWVLSGDDFNALEDLFTGVVEIVTQDNLVACLEKG